MEGSDAVLGQARSQKFVFPSTPQFSFVQGALLLASAAPVTPKKACPAVLVQHPLSTCVKDVEEDVMGYWTCNGVCRMRMAFSMDSASGWSGTWVCRHGDGSVLRWLVCGNAECLLVPSLNQWRFTLPLVEALCLLKAFCVRLHSC